MSATLETHVHMAHFSSQSPAQKKAKKSFRSENIGLYVNPVVASLHEFELSQNFQQIFVTEAQKNERKVLLVSHKSLTWAYTRVGGGSALLRPHGPDCRMNPSNKRPKKAPTGCSSTPSSSLLSQFAADTLPQACHEQVVAIYATPIYARCSTQLHNLKLCARFKECADARCCTWGQNPKKCRDLVSYWVISTVETCLWRKNLAPQAQFVWKF